MEQLALSTPYALRHSSKSAPPTSKDRTSSSSLETAHHLISRGRPKLDLGMELDMDGIAEPLKRVAPDVFEEMEDLRRHEFAATVAELHDSRKEERVDRDDGSGSKTASEVMEKRDGVAVSAVDVSGEREGEDVMIRDGGTHGGSQQETNDDGGLLVEGPPRGSLAQELTKSVSIVGGGDDPQQLTVGQPSPSWQLQAGQQLKETARTMDELHHTPLAKDKAA